MINEATLAESIRRLRQGERATLAQAMTLVESRHPRHQALSTQLLDAIMPYCGNALRLGVTGTPGAGKSTFLEAFGMLLIREGLKVAVIAVDPSSPVTGGSILGDKTRMNDLVRAEAAFIRPVPSSGHLGGASQRARELMLLCEAAGYDVVIVETVGVGQSETEVARMIQKFPKPIISMVEGSVWGGAFEMIMSSDLIIAASTSTFSMTPVNLGVPYNLVGIHNLTRDAGFHIVKELIFTASPITAQRALAVGILNHVVEVEELEDFTLQMAHHISEKAPLAIAVIKEELRVLGEAHTMNSDEFERIQGMRRAVYDSEDYQEGMNAFLEKRKPNFVGH